MSLEIYIHRITIKYKSVDISKYSGVWNSCRFTSNTVFRRPILAPLYNPTIFSHMLMSMTPDTASEKSADRLSKSYNLLH